MMDSHDCDHCSVRSIALFGEFDPQRVERFAAATYRSQHSPSTVLLTEGARPGEAFTLRDGIVKLSRSHGPGRTQIIRLLVPGDLLGIEGLFDEPSRYSAIALTPVTVCHLPLPLLKQLHDEEPGFTNALLRRWREALHEVESLAAELGTRKAEERIAAFLLNWRKKLRSHARRVAAEDHEWIPLPLSRAELGELLGLRVETISRVLARWKREGIFEERSGRLRIHDTTALHELIGEAATSPESAG
ncbi:hypothetical protein CKO15_02365 [Halorhodospira abdelmalekii]|uniref:Crp/Fnr family transcriptional regulator n=1 Tax=Halorhodospira abdelmalekii TaxID=421629 RepID=UPI00190492AC|nr:Crp/Fnr family transcriptional regulator [Halorhodospira abdelmalekii]MBK1734143.1 hypothetical protein [Halorhodospira abdelmalekii]